jgi:hypothetical protein
MEREKGRGGETERKAEKDIRENTQNRCLNILCNQIRNITYYQYAIFYWLHRPTMVNKRGKYNNVKIKRQVTSRSILDVTFHILLSGSE